MQVVGEHAGVEFGHNHALVAGEYLAGVGGQRVDVAEVSESYGVAGGAQLFGGGAQVAVGAAPAHEQCFGRGVAEDFEGGYVVGYAGDFFATQQYHLLVVYGVGGYCAGFGVFFKTTEPVGTSFGTSHGPVAAQVVGAHVRAPCA